jgi:hypothetical protein
MAKNKLRMYNDKEIIKLLEESKSLREFIIKIGYNSNGGGVYKYVKENLKNRNINIPIHENNEDDSNRFKEKYTNEEIFCENSTYNRTHLKTRIIKNKLIEYKCSKCGLTNTWQSESINLELEHKNGINNDNRLENLTFLCPNCHSQTKTYCKKK